MTSDTPKGTPTLVGSSVRSIIDEEQKFDPAFSSRSPSRSYVKNSGDPEKDYTTVNELVGEGALIHDEQVYDDLLDDSGKFRPDIPHSAHVPGGAGSSESFTEVESVESQDDVHTGGNNVSVSLNQSIEKVQEDKNDPENEVVVVDILKKSTGSGAGPDSIYDLGRNRQNEVSLEDLIDSQIASISEFSSDLKKKKKKGKKRSSPSPSRKNVEDVIPDHVIDNDSPQTVPAGVPEGLFSPLFPSSRSQSAVRSPSKLSHLDSSLEFPHLARGDSYKGTEEFRSGRKPVREDLRRVSGSRDYLQSVSRSRTRMNSTDKSASVGELADEGVLLHDSEHNQDLEYAQNQILDHVDLKVVDEADENDTSEDAEEDIEEPEVQAHNIKEENHEETQAEASTTEADEVNSEDPQETVDNSVEPANDSFKQSEELSEEESKDFETSNAEGSLEEELKETVESTPVADLETVNDSNEIETEGEKVTNDTETETSKAVDVGSEDIQFEPEVQHKDTEATDTVDKSKTVDAEDVPASETFHPEEERASETIHPEDEAASVTIQPEDVEDIIAKVDEKESIAVNSEENEESITADPLPETSGTLEQASIEGSPETTELSPKDKVSEVDEEQEQEADKTDNDAVSALVTNEVEPQETLPENTESKEALIEDDENSDAADTEVSKSDVPQEGVEETEDVDETKDSVDEIKDSVDETKDSVDETKDSVDDDEVAPSGSDEHTAAGSPADEELDPIAEKTASLSIHDETERLIQELEDEIVVPDTSKQETSEEVEKSLEVKDATSDLQVEEEAPEDDTEVKKVEETTESELAPTEKSVEIEQSEPAAESFKESESPVEENKETEAVPVEEEEEELHEPTREEIIEMLKDEPVYIYTSLAGGGYHMPQRTNRLVTILSSNRIPFTYRDLGTDDEARSVWRRYSNGRMLPAIVRGKDDIVGNFEEIEEANEDYRVRELIYETL